MLEIPSTTPLARSTWASSPRSPEPDRRPSDGAVVVMSSSECVNPKTYFGFVGDPRLDAARPSTPVPRAPPIRAAKSFFGALLSPKLSSVTTTPDASTSLAVKGSDFALGIASVERLDDIGAFGGSMAPPTPPPKPPPPPGPAGPMPVPPIPPMPPSNSNDSCIGISISIASKSAIPSRGARARSAELRNRRLDGALSYLDATWRFAANPYLIDRCTPYASTTGAAARSTHGEWRSASCR